MYELGGRAFGGAMADPPEQRFDLATAKEPSARLTASLRPTARANWL